MKRFVVIVLLLVSIVVVQAQTMEVTVQNDSITKLSEGAIQAGFVSGESAAAWLDSPCDGTIVAVQVFWRSLVGGAPQTIEDSIEIFDNGAFPIPGTLLETINAPVMTDGVFNEFRFLDDQMVIPLQVPVTQNQRFVVSFTFAEGPQASGPSVITDADGCQAGRNGLFAIPPGAWFSSCLLGLSGDFAIRAVIECPVVANEADLSVVKTADMPTYIAGQDLGYSITARNSGPTAITAATVIDFFPSEVTNVQWTCSGQGGASCPVGAGSGNLTQSVNLPVGGSLVYDAIGTVMVGAQGDISNTAQIVVPVGITDPQMANNMSTVVVTEAGDGEVLLIDGFES